MNNLARLRLGAALCPVNSLGYIEHYTPPYTTVCFFYHGSCYAEATSQRYFYTSLEIKHLLLKVK